MRRGDPLDDAGRGRHVFGLRHGKLDAPFIADLQNGHQDFLSRLSSEVSQGLEEGSQDRTGGDDMRRFEAEQAAACYGRAVKILQVGSNLVLGVQ